MLRDLPLSLLDPKDTADLLTPHGPAAEEAHLTRLFSEANEASVHVGHDWVVRYCNDVYLANIGLPRERVLGHTPFEYHPSFARSIFFDAIESARRDRRALCTIGFSSVLKRWMMVRVFPTSDGMLLLANDATETVVRQHQLAQQALADPLTGLGNKLALAQELQARIAADQPFSLTVTGLDRFTTVNDAQGYARGDLALMEIASRLQIATLANESLFRINGDEFAFISAGEPGAATARVRALLALTRRPVVLNGQSFVLGASAGTVLAPLHG